MIPLSCTWELTLKCNLRCKHCGSSAGNCRKDELSLQRCLELIDELDKLGNKEVTLIGGEPLMSEKWYPIAKKLSKLGKKINFVSNGTIMNDDIIKQLKETKINNFGLSIDGNKKTNDEIRGKGVFEKIISSIKKLQENNIKVSIATTISKHNFDDLEEVYKLLVDLGIKVWQIQLAIPIGRMDSSFMLEKHKLKDLIKFIIKVRKEKKIRIFPGCNVGYFGGLEKEYRIQEEEKDALNHWTGCYSGIFEVGIKSNGDVLGCMTMDDKFIEGNVANETLAKIWNAPNAFSYNRNFKSCNGGCKKCSYAEICRGGCPSISFATTKKTNNDPYCLERIEVLKC